jgi:AcrR family transcriptional regulator
VGRRRHGVTSVYRIVSRIVYNIVNPPRVREDGPVNTRKPRRAPADTRTALLAAAERRLVRDGPSALRLQDVAADVGVSHPALLHHFGSREGLVRAVIQGAIQSLQADLVRALANAEKPASGADLFERVFATLADEGHARLMAWLALSGYDPLDSDDIRANWAAIGDAAHALRLATSKGKRKPTREDTTFTVVLSALALFGQAIAGPATFRAAGLGDDPRVQRRFRAWLAALLAAHLDGG